MHASQAEGSDLFSITIFKTSHTIFSLKTRQEKIAKYRIKRLEKLDVLWYDYFKA